MRFSLTINGVEDYIEILNPAPLCRFRLGGAAESAAHVEEPERDVYSVLLDGCSYDARVEETVTGLVVVVIDGYRFEIQVQDPRRRSQKTGARHGHGAQTVCAPMPGKVVRVLVEQGDAVEAGQGLLVVEAMKMQNEMKATRAGRVARIATREGATVAAGEVLATIE